MRRAVRRVFLILSFLSVLGSGTWAALITVSDAEIIRAGKQAHEQAMRRYGAWNNPFQLARIRRLGSNLARFSERPEIHYRFYLVNDRELNAFATPDGSVHVTRGLAAAFTNNDELSFVMGHEITHVELNHAKKTLENELQTQLAGSLLLRALGVRGSVPARLGIGGLSTWINMKYSRDYETQADEGGMRLLQKEGINPEYGPRALERLFRLNREKPTLLSTYFGSHPLPADRIAHAKEFARELNSHKEG